MSEEVLYTISHSLPPPGWLQLRTALVEPTLEAVKLVGSRQVCCARSTAGSIISTAITKKNKCFFIIMFFLLYYLFFCK